jgi:KRAB domain-containing zinc finger protein
MKSPILIYKLLFSQICGEGLSNQQSLLLHVKTHNSVKKFHCDFCEASFHRKDKLIFHRRTHTGRIMKVFLLSNLDLFFFVGEKPFECDQCHKKFIRKAKLTEHLNRHKGLKNHECALCPKKYSGAYDLKIHQR